MNKRAFRTRRDGLVSLLCGETAVIASGSSVGRNYAANVYPFRASSHFLFFIGRNIENAYFVVDSNGARLYLRPQSSDDILWHGRHLSLAEWSELLGLPVCPLAELGELQLTTAMTLPGTHAQTRLNQSRLLGRTIEPDVAEHDQPLAHAVIKLRLENDAHGLRCLTETVQLAAKVHAAVPRFLQPGLTERDVWRQMQGEFTGAGFGLAYNPIITRRGEVLHGSVSGDRLESGDLLLLDVGCEHPDGWAADITRTWAVSGTYTASQADIYQAVLAAQSVAIDHCRSGHEYRDVHLMAAHSLTHSLCDLGILNGCPDMLFEDQIYAYFFPHGIGHLLGLDVHDMEDLGDLAGYESGRIRDPSMALRYLRLHRQLKPNMVVTIEPGFYQIPELLSQARESCPDRINWGKLESFTDVRGIRIEDDVLITEGTPMVLSVDAPK